MAGRIKISASIPIIIIFAILEKAERGDPETTENV